MQIVNTLENTTIHDSWYFCDMRGKTISMVYVWSQLSYQDKKLYILSNPNT